MNEKKEKVLPSRKPVPCRPGQLLLEKKRGRTPQYYNAFPRDCEFSYMTPSYYAIGFGILDVYKTEVDFSEYRRLTFMVDHSQVHKWGNLRKRIPYPEGRITDLPGTREMNYRNYCLRNLTPESAISWRNSIPQGLPVQRKPKLEEESEPTVECVCDRE